MNKQIHSGGGNETHRPEKSGSVHTGKSHSFDTRSNSRIHDNDRWNKDEGWNRKTHFLDYPYRPHFLEYIYRPYYISPFWQMIYNTVSNYPLIPSEYDKENMKMFISTLPTITPCSSDSCKAYIKDYVNFLNIDDITRSRKTIYNFFYKFRIDLFNLFGNEIADSDNNHYFHGVS